VVSKVLAVVVGAVWCVAVLMAATAVYADPCLMVYPESACTYHYDPVEYYTVGPGDPLYDPVFDRGGEVLIVAGRDEIEYNVYQAPNLLGFVADSENQGYFTLGTELDVVVDGFSNAPTTFVDILLVFDRVDPSSCQPTVVVEGQAAVYEPGLGWYHPVGDLNVSTPTPWGNNFSDTRTLAVTWGGCYGLRIYAFSDENHNRRRDGGECFSAFSHDTTVPVEETTWGRIKAVYGE
jgi:hypothetical protein